jgi:hypothetical protein
MASTASTRAGITRANAKPLTSITIDGKTAPAWDESHSLPLANGSQPLVGV